MVNPYASNPGQRGQPAKPQVLLGTSNALKKFEKFQSKYNPNQTSIERKKEKKKNKAVKHILDTTDEDDDSDDEDDSLIVRNANKFMKKKAPEVEAKAVTSDDSDIEISAIEGSNTPKGKRTKSPAPIINRSNNSSATSMRSASQTHRRSHSKVKFVNEYSEEESTILEDMLSKNLIMDIEDLEAHTASMSTKMNKAKPKVAQRRGKSPLAMAAQRRSDSVTSIQEESILEESVNEDAVSEAASLTNLIMDIHDLEASISKMERKEKKVHKQQRKRQDSESLSREKKIDKRNRNKKQVSSSIVTTNFDKSDSSILTESVADIDDDEEIKTVKSDMDDISTRSILTRSGTKEASASRSGHFTYQEDFGTTEKTTRHSTTRKEKDKKAHKRDKKDKKNKKDRDSSHKNKTPRTPRTVSYGFDDFETTDFDVDALSPRKEKKQLSFYEAKLKPIAQTSNAEIQCDPTDLLRNSTLMNTVNVYNPSSILLATASHLNSENTLRDLNQITGYTMINQAFTDILRVNINFVKNFLSAQRSMYEQQINTIQPKPRDY